MEYQGDLFHGSKTLFDVGVILEGRGDAYHEEWSQSDFYRGLEAHRPPGSISHKDAVFMCEDDDLDLCGGCLDVIYRVEPIGDVERHDMEWSSRVSCLIGDGFDILSEEVAEAAGKYWSGEASEDPVWEYLAKSMRIVEVVENNLCAPEP